MWTILVVLPSVSPRIQLSVVGPICYLFMLSFRLPPRGVSRVMGNKLASSVLEAIAIGLIKQREKNSNRF